MTASRRVLDTRRQANGVLLRRVLHLAAPGLHWTAEIPVARLVALLQSRTDMTPCEIARLLGQPHPSRLKALLNPAMGYL